MILSKIAILEEYKKGNIIYKSMVGNKIEDFAKNQSVDLHIGEYIYVNDIWQKLGGVIPKGTFFLAYTEEFIGTRGGSNIHPQFYQRSTMARKGLSHTLAAWGDVGFFNRWAMEYYTLKDIEIYPGDRVAQMSFNYTTESGDYTKETGNYQKANNIDEVVKLWDRDMILPINK